MTRVGGYDDPELGAKVDAEYEKAKPTSWTQVLVGAVCLFLVAVFVAALVARVAVTVAQLGWKLG